MLSNDKCVSSDYKCYSQLKDIMLPIHYVAIMCNRCLQPLLVEYHPVTEESIAYELTDLTNEQKKIVHRHQCNEQLRNSVINIVAVEKWHLLLQNRTFQN